MRSFSSSVDRVVRVAAEGEEVLVGAIARLTRGSMPRGFGLELLLRQVRRGVAFGVEIARGERELADPASRCR